MPISRRSFIARTAALAAVGGVEQNSEAGPQSSGVAADSQTHPITGKLQGYGTIARTFQVQAGGRASVLHIQCETHQKALLTQAKYLSDLERLPGVQKARLHGRREMPYRKTATGGALACMARGTEVLILAAADELALARLCDAPAPATAQPIDFEPRTTVPMYLDRWDRYGLLLYYAPDATPPENTELFKNFDYADGVKFARDNGNLGIVLWSNPLVDDHAEGITNVQDWNWVQTYARKMGVPLHVNTQISYPQLWLSNRYREQTMLKAPQFLGGYYGVAHDSAVAGAVSWVSQEAEDVQLGVFQEIVRRYAQDSNIVGYLEPHGETYEYPQKYFLESGPLADESMRDFLRQRYKSLEAVSTRWHGEATYYKSWNDVHLPEIAEFAGFVGDAIDLRGTWRVKYVPGPNGKIYTRDEARNLPSPPPTAVVPPEWYGPDFDDSAWDEFVAPGNDRMLFMARSPLVYRRTVEIPAEWLAANPRVTLTIWDLVNRDADLTLVYINGKPASERTHGANDQHWSRFDITGMLKPGRNLFVLNMPRAIICYRAYLSKNDLSKDAAKTEAKQEAKKESKTESLQYPHLGKHANAKWVDFANWIITTRGAQIRRGAEMIRQVAPNGSINFMTASDYADPVKRACQDYGGRFHDTGAMAGFWTEEYTLLMNGIGLPVTAEPGNGAPNSREFQLFWGRWLTEGVTGVHYFQSWGEIAWNPEVLAVFKANRPIYETVGKYHTPFARVAVLFDLQSQWLTGFPWAVEPGTQGGYYSGYNAAGHLINYCPRDGIGAKDFDTATVKRFKVIIDSNTVFMDDNLIGGIERYVRTGGVFVTYGQSGRHSPTEPDSWPISRLTGYTVAQEHRWGDGKLLTLSPGQKVFTPTDISADPRASGIGFKATAADCQPLALWEDGTVAIGMRPIGAGWIVSLGPMIGNAQFVAIVGALLRHFGVTDRVPATVTPQRGLHFRHFIGNTGLHDVWILFNESDAAVKTDLKFLPGIHPSTLTDRVTDEKLQVVRTNDGDSISDIALAPWQTKMFTSPRSDVAASPLEWMRLQEGWWQGTVKPPAKRLPRAADMQRFTMDLSRGWAYKNVAGLTDDEAAALTKPEFDDSRWERREIDLWLSPGDRNLKRHLIRRKFTVPAHWNAGQVVVCADLPGQQFYGDTRTFLDGSVWFDGRKSVDGPYFEGFGGALKAGTTHVLAFDIQGKSTLTGSRGPVWLTYLPDPGERQDLAGSWSVYSDSVRRIGEAYLPGNAKGMYFTREAVIDAAHRDKNVVIYFEAGYERYSILINHTRINSSELFRNRSFGFNVTPMINFGEKNLIEIVTSSSESKVTISVVEIRYYDKGVYP